MSALIDMAFGRSRAVLLMLGFVLVAGSLAWQAIPKESEPDIAIPIVYVSLSHEGISPEDAERLLIRPMEKELQSIEGIKEMRSTAGEGHGSVTLEFDAGFDSKRALDDVREKVDIAKAELPDETDEPTVHEVNVALFPVLTVALSGSLPERALIRIARDLKDRIEALPQVLEVDVGGDREDLLEVLVDPLVLDTYGLRFEQVISLIGNNNLPVAAGAVDTGAGRIVVKVPGVIEDISDMLDMPVKVENGHVVTFREVASVRKTFKDPNGFARVNGQPAVTLEVKKRLGANIIRTIEAVRAVVEGERTRWPVSVQVAYLQDKSNEIRDMLGDLSNNVVSAILLVMIVIVAALGLRSATLVGLTIPASFLAGILILHHLGYTLNIVVLFSLILVVGMLVDGAIVVSELADRHLAEGLSPTQAYAGAAKRMSWPIAASTATTLVVFLPLMFWPGIVGEFMRYLPLTVMINLGAALAMALVFIPVLGSVLARFGQRMVPSAPAADTLTVRAYARVLEFLLPHAGKVLGAAVLVLVGSYVAYAALGRGIEFFPDVEPEFAQVQIRARGDLSIHEKDALVRRVESRIADMSELRSVYARSFNSGGEDARGEDVVGVIQLQFVDWETRRPAAAILSEMRKRTADVAGILLEFRKQENGPSEGKPIKIQLSSRHPEGLADAAATVRAAMDRVGGFVDVEDNRPLPGIEWRLEVDRQEAARYGADIRLLGYAVQMVTNGIRVAGYRPEDADDEVDIRVRFPFAERNLDRLDELGVPTAAGMLPVTNFVRLVPAPKTGTLRRADSQRVITVQADVADGLLVDDKLRELRAALAKTPVQPSTTLTFKGEDEDQREAATFLQNAFLGAVFLMAMILVIQFNNLYQAGLVLSAIVFSTAGVLLGLLATSQPFGIVMVGIGIIALAGIVVNNNIILIDTYNVNRRSGMEPMLAALETGRVRLRPVFLTAVTTVLGLMPMVLAVNIDLINRHVTVGAPSTQWWTQLASAIAGGLSFATVLTLILTPCLLVLGERINARLGTIFLTRFGRRAQSVGAAGPG